MGLLSLLASRTNSQRPYEADALGYRSYNSTVVSLPPVRGNRTVPDNGPVSREGLSEAAALQSASRQRSGLLSKPYFLGIREETPHRMSYHNLAAGSSLSLGQSLRSSRTSSSPMLSKGARRRLTRRLETPRERPETPFFVSNATFSSRSSVITARMPSRHVDILDAHGEIRPCDFKSRVEATGTKDYGEDVAERNMELKIPRHTSSPTQSVTPSIKNRATGGDGITYGVDSIESMLPSSTLKMFSQRQERTKSMAAVRSDESLAKDRRRRRELRAKSLFCESGSNAINQGISIRDRRNDEKFFSKARSVQSRRRRPESISSSLSASPPDVPRYRSGSLNSLAAEYATAQLLTFSTPNRILHINSRTRTGNQVADLCRLGADSTTGSKSRRHSDAYQRHEHSYHHRRLSDSRSLCQDPTHDREFRASRREVVESSDDGNLVESAPAPDIPGIRKYSRNTIAVAPWSPPRWKSPWSHSNRPSITSLIGPTERPSSGCHRRGRSSFGTAPPFSADMEDIMKQIPARVSSLRQWSISSLTPTTELSDHSSNAAARPQSNHTADTSVDLSVRKAPMHPGPNSRSRGNSESRLSGVVAEAMSATHRTARSRRWTGSETGQLQGAVGGSEYYNEERYAMSTTDSSDADSFTEGQWRRRDTEPLASWGRSNGEDLANHLPGLVGSGGGTGCLMCSLLQQAALEMPASPEGPCNHKGSISRRERLRALGYQYDTEESSSDSDESIARSLSIRRTASANTGMRGRVTVDGRIEENVAEEDDDSRGSFKGMREATTMATASVKRHRSDDGRAGGFAIEPVLEDHEEGVAV